MKENSYTKGEWTISHDPTPDWEGGWYIFADKKCICEGEINGGETLANAQLIASAPEAIEALKDSEDLLHEIKYSKVVNDNLITKISILEIAIGKIINKAEGV